MKTKKEEFTAKFAYKSFTPQFKEQALEHADLNGTTSSWCWKPSGSGFCDPSFRLSPVGLYPIQNRQKAVWVTTQFPQRQ
jgi:hypothetical protein